MFLNRQLGQESYKEKNPRHWQNELLETCAEKSKERFQRGHQGQVSQEKISCRSEMRSLKRFVRSMSLVLSDCTQSLFLFT